MTRMKKATGKETKLPNSLAKGRKPPAEEGINKTKLAGFRELLVHGDSEKVSEMLMKHPEDVIIIAELLSDRYVNVRERAAKTLGRTAEKRADITAAISALAKALGDENMNVRAEVARTFWEAASRGGVITTAIPALVIALGDRFSGIRKRAAWALGHAAQQGADITTAIPALVKLLGDEEPEVREGATRALGNAAEKGADITSAIPALVKLLGDGDARIRESAIWALENAKRDRKTRILIINEFLGYLHSDWFQDEMWKNSKAFERTTKGIAEFLDKLRKAEVAQP